MLTALSLFTSGGIGDLALRAAGFHIRVSCELHPDRHAVFSHNFPTTTTITGDICQKQSEILAATKACLGRRTLDLLYATPPCQGMSRNGRGKLLSAIRAGRKPSLDPRNRLIIPTIELAKKLRPRIILLENVPEMADTVILNDAGKPQLILDYVREQLGPDYVGGAQVVEFADYGVPQCRQRLITIFSRDPALRRHFRSAGTFLPPATHSQSPEPGKRPWLTVRDAIADLPSLDAATPKKAQSKIPFHRVPLLDEMKYWWVQSTPPERGAFDNQCVSCGFDGNPTHGARRTHDGINRSSKNTPLHCQRCGQLLPRPSVQRNGRRILMSGFTSAYRRMSWQKPASALTRNLSYACSDNKLHPQQHRVLSLYEAFRIHTLDQFDYQWQRADGKPLADKTIRELIGESIPPAGFRTIVQHLAHLYRNASPPRLRLRD